MGIALLVDGFAAVGFSMGGGSEWVQSPPSWLLVVGNAIKGGKEKEKGGGEVGRKG